uniref:Dynein regulatory complex protein 10 n=1 Tax=Schistosoma mansoni TaxID=6183 RepID=A0A5K4F5A2_SCHMA
MKTQEMLLEKLIETNRSEEETIRATIYKMESDIESKISKYDQEMTILQDEYDALEAEYTEEKSAYDELNERFQVGQNCLLEVEFSVFK